METQVAKQQENLREQALRITSQEDLAAFSKQLNKYVTDNNLFTDIQGKKYVNVDGWKFAGAMFGFTPIVEKPVELFPEKYIRIGFYNVQKTKYNGGTYTKEEIGIVVDPEKVEIFDIWKKSVGASYTREIIRPLVCYEVEAKIIRVSDGKLMGTGTGLCENSETSKVSYDRYAIQSMSQTRAIAKAYRNTIGFIMNQAGYESTPAEEMTDIPHKDESVEPRQKPINDKQLEKLLQEVRKDGQVKYDLGYEHFTFNGAQTARMEDALKEHNRNTSTK